MSVAIAYCCESMVVTYFCRIRKGNEPMQIKGRLNDSVEKVKEDKRKGKREKKKGRKKERSKRERKVKGRIRKEEKEGNFQILT